VPVAIIITFAGEFGMMKDESWNPYLILSNSLSEQLFKTDSLSWANLLKQPTQMSPVDD